MLAQRLHRWPNINPALCHRLPSAVTPAFFCHLSWRTECSGVTRNARRLCQFNYRDAPVVRITHADPLPLFPVHRNPFMTAPPRALADCRRQKLVPCASAGLARSHNVISKHARSH